LTFVSPWFCRAFAVVRCQYSGQLRSGQPSLIQVRISARRVVSAFKCPVYNGGYAQWVEVMLTPVGARGLAFTGALAYSIFYSRGMGEDVALSHLADRW